MVFRCCDVHILSNIPLTSPQHGQQVEKQNASPTLIDRLSYMMNSDASIEKGRVLPVDDIPDVDNRLYDNDEYSLRCKLASLHRVINMYGANSGPVSDHVSVRVNNNANQFLVKPHALGFHEVTASSLINIDVNGVILHSGSTGFNANVQSFLLYATIYNNRPDLNCLIHVRGPSVSAVSAMKCGLLHVCQEACICGPIASQTIDIDASMKRLSIGDGIGDPKVKIFILRNYGILACGETIEEAWYRAFHVMIACETQIRALSMGIGNLILSSEEASNQVQKTVKTGGGGVSTGDTAWAIGELEWSALMNVLDTAGYHTGYAYRGPFLRNV
ncbi:unnamed protein product [Rotaria magnacalcarata]|uniref:Class II aldolase/adducin N-terminal domain-containing protein n=2 Tax=Rotaria magnacalcarata TaxID=392030 RepID=A0A819IS59_9BILA|nr:unnamed protein product [Rotaria magnacalcarata]